MALLGRMLLDSAGFLEHEFPVRLSNALYTIPALSCNETVCRMLPESAEYLGY